MQNCIKLLAVANMFTILIGVFFGILLLFAAYDFGRKIILGFKSGIFEISDTWHIQFRIKPIIFCLLIFLYAVLFVLVLGIAWYMNYNNFFK